MLGGGINEQRAQHLIDRRGQLTNDFTAAGAGEIAFLEIRADPVQIALGDFPRLARGLEVLQQLGLIGRALSRSRGDGAVLIDECTHRVPAVTS